MIDQPTAEDALKKLKPLLGEWALWSEAHRTASAGPAKHGLASSTTSPARTSSRAPRSTCPNAPDTVSIIGCDAANGTYFQLYSDDRGVCRVYQISIGHREWKLWREGEPFPQRFAATITKDGDKVSGRWEKADELTARPTSS